MHLTNINVKCKTKSATADSDYQLILDLIIEYKKK